VTALAGLAHSDARFGKDYVVPGLLDDRLLPTVTPKIAQAAMRSGVARKELDMTAYFERLEALGKQLL
jgi:malate dehydrogenase (oxaloacetate-decarboxylating)(NADP+)